MATNTRGFSWNSLQNLIQIEALRKSAILCPEGKEILSKRIRVAESELAYWKNAESIALSKGYNNIAPVYRNIINQMECHLKEG